MAAQFDTCRGKRRYPSRAKARKYRRLAWELAGQRVRVYFHAECDGWHLTSQPLAQTTPANRNPR